MFLAVQALMSSEALYDVTNIHFDLDIGIDQLIVDVAQNRLLGAHGKEDGPTT